ncbi:MAG: hypothetical protein EAY75_14430 [Bacteroidetes bacterium]|nr:MAG: hypothetical protein EAY75_14430 [Bacteroidota bacterium]
MDKSIIPECYADTLLIQTLVPTAKGYNHQHNCFKVEQTLKKLEGFGLGVIDDDKRTIKYLEHFELIDEVVGDLRLWRQFRGETHHWIIQICPALEMWIIKVCKDEKIDNGDVPLELEALRKYTKSLSSLKNAGLRSLFQILKERETNKSVRKLKGWITLLKEKNYSVDINALRHV